MKNNIKTLILLLLVSIFISCDEEDDKVVINSESATAASITTQDLSVELSEATAGDDALTLEWNHGSYDIPTQINYLIEAALTDTNFEVSETLAITTKNTFSWKISEINDLFLKLGSLENQESSIEFRIKSNIGKDNVFEKISNTFKLTATPYEVTVIEENFINLFIVGNVVDINEDGILTDDDWNPGLKNPYLFRDPANPNKYQITINFGSGGFKLLENFGEWQPQWGPVGNDKITNNELNGGDPDAFTVSSAGYYKLEVDIESLTYSLKTRDVSSNPTYSTIGLIGSTRTGDASGWDAPDTDLIQSSLNPHIWYIQDIELKDGAAKFRAEDAWDVNWGGDSFPSAISSSSGDINVTEGKYDIWFNDLDGNYIFVKKN